MDSKSLKRTLILYLAFAFLVSSILTILCLLIEYTPSAKNSIQKFGIGAMILNSVLWSLLFTVTGSSSLINVHASIRKNFIISLVCFVLLPILALIAVLTLVKIPGDVFGITEAAIAFLITQLFFFFRFRSCIKRTNQITID
jgi:hypothetical protein